MGSSVGGFYSETSSTPNPPLSVPQPPLRLSPVRWRHGRAGLFVLALLLHAFRKRVCDNRGVKLAVAFVLGIAVLGLLLVFFV